MNLSELKMTVGVDNVTRYHKLTGGIAHVCVGMTSERMAEISALQDLPTQPEQLAESIKQLVIHPSMDKATKDSLSMIVDQLSIHATKNRAAALGAIKELTQIAKLGIRPEDSPEKNTWIVISISDKALEGVEEHSALIDEMWAADL